MRSGRALFAGILVGCATAAGAVVPASRDAPYLGPVALAVDATDFRHRVVDVRETLPVRAGPLTLVYAQWIPGTHSPVHRVKRLAGLTIAAGGRTLAWTRDATDVHAFHVVVPPGTTALDIRFQHLMPAEADSVASWMTDRQGVLKWEGFVLAPAGHYASRIDVDATLTLPAGWKQASALRPLDGASDGPVRYARVSFETLVDSPVFVGLHARRYELDPPGAPRPVALAVFAGDAAALEAPPEALAAHRSLVEQADRLFGARHFAHYDLLLTLSGDDLPYGLEHHQSSENSGRPGYFADWPKSVTDRYVVPHEYVHSWNGKYRRPRSLWAPDFNTASRNDLLWVYEGQTQYWGEVLAARSGMLPVDAVRDRIANVAAWLAVARGRDWRSLQDTTFDEIVQGREQPPDWVSWQRSADYYDEGLLIWLAADARIREASEERRSLDDFARAFFGGTDGDLGPKLYEFDDVTATLGRVQPVEWRRWLRERLDSVGPLSLAGLERTGWRLAWTDRRSDYAKHKEAYSEQASFVHSLGFWLDKKGVVAGVLWDGLAFKAGMTSGQKLLAVDLKAYKPDVLREALVAATTRREPIELLLQDGADYRIARLDWHGGPRYPTLERIEGTPDRLSAILAPRP